jgi:hypothetical protein
MGLRRRGALVEQGLDLRVYGHVGSSMVPLVAAMIAGI